MNQLQMCALSSHWVNLSLGSGVGSVRSVGGKRCSNSVFPGTVGQSFSGTGK